MTRHPSRYWSQVDTPVILFYNNLDRAGISAPVIERQDGYFLIRFQKTDQINKALCALNDLIVDGQDDVPFLKAGLSQGTFGINLNDDYALIGV